MAKKYQIIKRVAGKDTKWEFVAHGSRFDKENALGMCDLIKSHGSKVRLLPL